MAIAERPISTVLRDIVGNLQDIVRSELRLAKTEVLEGMEKTSRAGVLCGVGALLLVFSTMFVLLAGVFALRLLMPDWAAALSVAAGVAVIAAICLGIGVKKLKSVRAAPKTAATLKENAEWAKQLSR